MTNNNVVIAVGDDSVTILVAAYADGRYSIHYGDSDTALGRLAIGTTGENPLLTGTDDADLMLDLAGIGTLTGGAGDDTLYGQKGGDTLTGGAGEDTLYGGTQGELYGGNGIDTYVFSVGDGADTLYDETGDTMTLRFESSSYTYALTDFNSDNINKVGNDLEITIDINSNDNIDDKITIKDAFVTDSTTGTDSPAFTINIQYGSDDTFLEVADAFWNTLS